MTLRKTAIIVGVLTGLASLAPANVIQVAISGNISSSNMSAFPAGQAVSVTLTYESSGAPQFISNNQAFYVDHLQSVSMVSGSYSSSYSAGPFGQIDKYDNLSNTDGIGFQFESNAAGYGFTNPKPHTVQLASVVSNNVTQTFGNLGVNLASSTGTIWNDYNLPVVYNVASFDGNHSITASFSGGGFQVIAGTVTVKDLTASRIPVLTSVSPTATPYGQAFTLTANGSGFASGDTVCLSQPYGTANCTSPTTFVSSTQLTAVIPVTLITSAGTAAVQVATAQQVFSGPANLIVAIPPTITRITPLTSQQGGAAFTLTVTGDGFVAGSVVNWNGDPRPTTFVAANQITAAIPASDLAIPGTALITVSNPLPAVTSKPFGFTVSPPPSPVPTLSSLAPASAPSRSAAFSLLVNGTNFVSGAVVRWNGSARDTSFVSSTLLAASIPATDLQTAGSAASVTVVNPAPGGGTSAAANFAITNPAPIVIFVSPAAVRAGSNGVTIAVAGVNFVQASNVNWNGSSRPTTFVSATQVNATISAADFVNTGTSQVTVVNPSPGGGTSNAFGFSVGPASGGNGIPTVTSVSPTSIPAGSAGFTLTVNGINFTISSVVRWNGLNRNTTYVSATQLKAFVYSDDLPGTSIGQVSVYTPPPGGGASNATSFTVSAPVVNPAPVINTPVPSLIYSSAGGFTLTIAGTGFVPGSVVRWNGVNLVTTFLNALSVSALVPANLVASNGTGSVVVFSPAPGGGLSPAFTVRIVSAPATNPVPVVTSFFPTSWTIGALDFTLKVTGTGFVPGSIVTINGRTHATTFVSDTLLWVAMTLADSALSGSLQVTVSNPAPGGGVSPAALFSILDLPVIKAGGIINAASLNPSQLAAAAGIGALFGFNFSVDVVVTTSVPWPTTLGGLTLTLNGIPAPLLYVTPQQIGFQFPWELAGLTKVTVQTTLNGVVSAPQTITLDPVSPGLFTMSQTGVGQGAVLIANTGTLAAAPGSVAGIECQPVTKSGYISIYTTGLGPVENPPANGAAGGSDPLSRTVTLPKVTVGGIDAPVLFSGLAPSLVGVYQVNAQIPADAPSGNAVPVTVSIGGIPGNPVTIAIE